METSVGKYLRKLRLSKGEILKTMATNLGVSSAFLSAVENGKKKLPEAWYEKLYRYYNLSSKQMEELKRAVIESNDMVEIDIRNTTEINRKFAISFARQFDSLDEETCQQLLRILNKDNGDEH